MFKRAPILPQTTVFGRIRNWLRCCVLPRPRYSLHSSRTLHYIGSTWTLWGARRAVKLNQWTIEEISPSGFILVDDLQPGMCPCLCGKRAEDCGFKPKETT